MKEKFREFKGRGEKSKMIERCNQILDDYSDQGYQLTLRQLYYQLVSKDIIPNQTEEYSKLSTTMVVARMGGLTDWEAIEDRVRIPYLEYAVNSVNQALDDTLNQYKRNRQEGQDLYVEIWTEKDAVSNILKRITDSFHIRLMVNRGYSSCSAMYRSAKRFLHCGIRKGMILYVGDHDPSGLDMLRDIEDRMYEFYVEELEIIPVALTMEQIKEFDPPPNPAKISDPRAKWYISKHGNSSWELDALNPKALHDIVSKAVRENINMEQYSHMIIEETEDKKQLKELIK